MPIKNRNIRSKPPRLIISVESRKGGVGKTTAALCMGRLLRKHGYAVLFLDLDVTGTNAADIVNSPFWREDIHAIQSFSKVDDNANDKSYPANLLAVFDEWFMAGKGLPVFSLSESKGESMRVDLEKMNVYGSQIYRTSSVKKAGNNNGQSTTCIKRPGILFDDLYSTWLLEYVKQTIDEFVRVATIGKPNKVAIILDNSPGFVGIAPAIHEWLTDLGPIGGKFLTVSSLDTQDLLACEQAVDALHNLYVMKWKTSRLFNERPGKGQDLCLNKNQEAFFIRLATDPDGNNAAGHPLAFYGSKSLNMSGVQTNEYGAETCQYPSRYMAAVINRVPRAVKSGYLLYDFEHVHMQNKGVLAQLLGGDERGQIARERMVRYDEYIENQFLLESIRRGRRRPEARIHRLEQFLAITEHELVTRIHMADPMPTGLLAADMSHYEQLRGDLVLANEVVGRARTALDDAGLGHLARLIRDEWLPGSIMTGFRSALMRFLSESDIPHFGMMPLEYDTESNNQQVREVVRQFKRRIIMGARESAIKQPEKADEKTEEVLAELLSSLVGLSIASPIWKSSFKDEAAKIFASVLAVELAHWSMKSRERHKSGSVQRFLAQESLKAGEFDKEERLNKNFNIFHHVMIHENEGGFADFYKVCTSAQARLIDFTMDSRFLIQLMQYIVKGEYKRGQLFPFVQGLAEDVIVEKTVPHADVPRQMAQAMMSAEYFREFDGVLKKVMADWGLANA